MTTSAAKSVGKKVLGALVLGATFLGALTMLARAEAEIGRASCRERV